MPPRPTDAASKHNYSKGMRPTDTTLVIRSGQIIRRMLLILPALLATFISAGCGKAGPVTVAVIPRTSGTLLWDPEQRGALSAAAELGLRIYWNASTREDDVDGQIALVERVSSGRYQGLVLAPNHALALMTPVRRALARGMPTVIVSSPMPIPADDNLFSILNDEEEGGRLAAKRVAELIGGRGSLAVIGIDPDIAGIVLRANSLEQALASAYPEIHIVVRRAGSFNVAHEQQGAREVLKEHPSLNAIVALTSTSTRGAISAIESDAGGSSGHGLSPSARSNSAAIRVIGFDPDSLLFESSALDAVIVQDTQAMGEQAIRTIYAKLRGQPVSRLVKLKPVLVTRENVNSPRVQQMTASDWRPGSLHRQLGSTP